MSDLAQVSENPKTARYGPEYPHYQNRPVETQARSGVEHVACPNVTQKPAHHSRNPPKCRPAHGVLREIGQASQAKHEQSQNPDALALLNQGAENKNPHGIDHEMRDSKVHENGREEPPDFSMPNFRQARFPTEVCGVKKAITGDAEIIHQRLVGSKTGQNGDGETGDKQGQRQPANFQPAGWKKDPECRRIPLWEFSAHAFQNS